MARVWLFLLGIALAACAMDDKGTVGLASADVV